MGKRRKKKNRRERRRRQAEKAAKKEAAQKPKRSYKIPLIGTAVAALALTGALIYHWAAGKRPEYPIRTTTPTEQVVPKQETPAEVKTPLTTGGDVSPLEKRLSEVYPTHEQRMEFVRNLSDIVDIPHYLVGIEYRTSFERIGEVDNLYAGIEPDMVTTPAEKRKWRDVGKKLLKSKTIVLPGAFERSKNEKEFMLSLRHEFNMAKIFYEGFDEIPMRAFFSRGRDGKPEFNTTLFHLVAELESYDKDIKRAIREGIGKSRVDIAKRYYLRHYKHLGDRQSPVPRKIREKLQTMFYREFLEDQRLYPGWSPPGNITFEQVASDPNPGLRQAYLNQIGRNRHKYGDKAWDSFLSIEYDPGFKRLAAKRAELGITETKSSYGLGPDVDLAMAETPFLNGWGSKCSTWVSKYAFIYTQNEDELLSILDNEASSAIFCEKRVAHFPTEMKGRTKDMDVYFKVIEIISFDAQFSKIDRGIRRVTPLHVERFSEPARDLFAELVDLSKQDIPDAPYIAHVIDAIRARPTIKYFE